MGCCMWTTFEVVLIAGSSLLGTRSFSTCSMWSHLTMALHEWSPWLVDDLHCEKTCISRYCVPKSLFFFPHCSFSLSLYDECYC